MLNKAAVHEQQQLYIFALLFTGPNPATAEISGKIPIHFYGAGSVL